jgi:hypothetical protein
VDHNRLTLPSRCLDTGRVSPYEEVFLIVGRVNGSIGRGGGTVFWSPMVVRLEDRSRNEVSSFVEMIIMVI